MRAKNRLGGVPGVLWSPAEGSDRAPLVLMGHGGGTHKKAPAMAGRAHRLVTTCGFHVAVIDAPGHGGRPRTAYDEREIAAMQRAMATGEPVGPIVVRYNAHLAERAVPEWGATLDALQELPEIGADGPVGHHRVQDVAAAPVVAHQVDGFGEAGQLADQPVVVLGDGRAEPGRPVGDVTEMRVKGATG